MGGSLFHEKASQVLADLLFLDLPPHFGLPLVVGYLVNEVVVLTEVGQV